MKTSLLLILSIFVISNISLFSQSHVTGSSSCLQCANTTADGDYSTAIGYRTSASGNYSFAGGNNSQSSGVNSFAFGNRCTAGTEESTISLGSYARALASNSITIGSGYPITNGMSPQFVSLDNNIANSIMFGVTSSVPTLTIVKSSSPSYNSEAGFVGIGTTNPQKRLHVDGDMLLSNGSMNFVLSLSGNTFFSIGSETGKFDINKIFSPTGGAEGYTSNMLTITDNGNTGIGVSNPTDKLSVNGNISATANISASGKATVKSLWLQDTVKISSNNSHPCWNINRISSNNTLKIEFDNAEPMGGGGDEDPIINNQVVITTDGKLGIRTSSPQATLDVNGNIKGVNFTSTGFLDVAGNATIGAELTVTSLSSNANKLLKIGANGQFTAGSVFESADGKIGIGTTNPSEMLEVTGNTKTNNIIVTSLASNTNKLLRIGANGQFTASSIFENSNGEIGIGTTNLSGAKFAVNGQIRCKEVLVENANWSDFVFEKGYKLMSISDLSSYIESNKHLPDVPTQAEIDANGLNVGEMNAVMLQKIEELTLYIIELKNEIEILKAK